MNWRQRRLRERLARLRAKKDYLDRMMTRVKDFPSYYVDWTSDITGDIAALEERMKILYGEPSPESTAATQPKDGVIT